jgi:Flp pilus assembly protein TadB
MTSLTFALLAAAVALLGGSGRAAAGRLAALRPASPESRSPPVSARQAAVAAVALGVAVVVGGPAGVVAAALSGVGASRLLRRLEPAASRRLRELRAARLPITLDLLAVSLRAGSPLVVALEVVSTALPGPLATDLATVARLQRLGAGVDAAWSRYLDDPALGPVVRSVRRSASSGSALAATFERLAAERRDALAAAGEMRARRAGVLATMPLGLCFLPAFVSLSVVPFALSLAGTVLR